MILVVCGVAGMTAQRQDGKNRQQMMKELLEFKIKYVAQEIELQDDQMEPFAQLYKEMSIKRRDCMMEAWKLEKKVKRNDAATEADYEAAAEAMNKAKAEDAAIEKAYDDKFAEFLTPKQVYKMKVAENEFRKKMEEMRHKKGPRGPKNK